MSTSEKVKGALLWADFQAWSDKMPDDLPVEPVPMALVAALRKWMQMQSSANTNELYYQARKFFKLPWVDPDDD